MNVMAAPHKLNNTDASNGERPVSVSTNETYWGYITRCQTCDSSKAVILQWLAAFVGFALLIAAFGFWVIPGSVFTDDIAGIKLAMSSLFGVIGVTMIWFASHGTNYELQVDLARMELREALRNTKGVARVQNRILFEEIEAVYIDRATTENGKSRLLLRLGKSPQLIDVAYDYEEHLTRLRDRLGRDILGKNALPQTKSNRGFILDGAKGVIKPESEAIA